MGSYVAAACLLNQDMRATEVVGEDVVNKVEERKEFKKKNSRTHEELHR